MAAASQKVGKSLLKFFKPVRIGFPEKQEQSNKSKGFQVLSFKKPDSEKQPDEQLLSKKKKQQTPPPNPDANWVEAISYIVEACKTTTDSIGHKIAVPAYKKVMNSKISQKVKFIGSIVNTNLDEAEEKFHRIRLIEEAKMQKERARLRAENGEDGIEEEATLKAEPTAEDLEAERSAEIEKNKETLKQKRKEMKEKQAA